MGRKVADCRYFPSDERLHADDLGREGPARPCREPEHAVTVHGHEDTDEVRAWLRQNLKDEVPA